MSYSGDAAEQIVRMTLETTEVAARITGKGAREVAKLLYAVLRDEKKTKGKTFLANMIRSGKELKVFAVQDKDLAKFCTHAKEYGILYCVLKDKDARDGVTDVMVRAEDASKVNRIFERFRLTTVDMASVRSEIEQAKQKNEEEPQEPQRRGKRRTKEDVFLDALTQNTEPTEEFILNPTRARTTKSDPSVPSSDRSESREEPAEREKRPSVRKQLQEIKDAMRAKAAEPKTEPETILHVAPPVNVKIGKER